MKKWMACLLALLIAIQGVSGMIALAEEDIVPVENGEVTDNPTEPPAEPTELPVETTDPPVESTEPPVETTDPPVESTNPPVETADPPVESTDPPVETADPSVETTDPPIETTDPPVETTDPPVETTDPPIETTDPPVESAEPPVEPTEPLVDPTDPPEESGDTDATGDAYIEADGVRHYADIETLIPYGLEGQTLYLFHTMLIEIDTALIADYDIEKVAEIAFALCPDEGTEFDGSTVVNLSETGPYGEDEPGMDYLWAGRPLRVEREDEPTADEKPAVTEWELQVQPEGYSETEPCEPTFTLVAFPDLQNGMYFAVSHNDGTPTALEGNRFTARYSGTYQFWIIGKDSLSLASSRSFSVAVPEVETVWTIEYDEEETDEAEVKADEPEEETKALALSDDVPVFLLTVEDDEPEESLTLIVAATAYDADSWVNKAPEFTLSVEAQNTTRAYDYAVSVDDGAPKPLGQAVDAPTDDEAAVHSASYIPAEQGMHQYRFLLIDRETLAEVPGTDTVFAVKLDTVAPVMTVTSAKEYKMEVIVGDSTSKGAKVSVDGGKTWKALPVDKDGKGVSSLAYTAMKETTFATGQIIAMDNAGNTCANTAAFTLYAALPTTGTMPGKGGFGGSFGGKGGSSRTVYHSKSTVDDVIAYQAVELSVDAQGMSQLVIGQEQLPLQLSRASFQVQEGVTEEPTFTASFASWNGDDHLDTLLLSVTPEASPLGQDGYVWSFSGAVYKTLATSGIDYIMLRVGDEVAALSTSGFTAGVRYNMYRADGLPSKDFLYRIRMNDEGATPFEMDVTVDGSTYPMSDDTTAEMYYYDIYCGTADAFRALKR